MAIVRNRYQKWKEHDEISKIFNFEVTDVKVQQFTVMRLRLKITKTYRKKTAGRQAFPSSIQIFYNFQTFKLS